MATKRLVSLSDVAADEELLEVGRRAIEVSLVQFRDGRISELGRGNGLVIREANGLDSSVIRFGPETALRIGLKAMATAVNKRKKH